LINYFVNSKGRAKHSFISSLLFKHPKVKKLLEILANASNKSTDFERRRFLSIVRAAGFTLNEAKAAGFKCFNDSWHTAGVHASESFPGGAVPETRGRPAFDIQDACNIIEKFLQSTKFSRPASSSVTSKKKNFFW
jgi:hypothetical protein